MQDLRATTEMAGGPVPQAGRILRAALQSA